MSAHEIFWIYSIYTPFKNADVRMHTLAHICTHAAMRAQQAHRHLCIHNSHQSFNRTDLQMLAFKSFGFQFKPMKLTAVDSCQKKIVRHQVSIPEGNYRLVFGKSIFCVCEHPICRAISANVRSPLLSAPTKDLAALRSSHTLNWSIMPAITANTGKFGVLCATT